MREAALALQLHLDRHAAQFLERHAALVEVGADLLRLRGGDVHLDIDRVELEDLRQHGILRRRPDEVARIDRVAAHLPVEGRAHLGVGQVQLREVHRGLGAQDVRLRRGALVDPVVHLDLRRRIAAYQRGVARDLGRGMRQLRAVELQLRLRLAELRLVLVLLDGEEQVALADRLAVLEMDALEVAGYARDQAHRIHRRGVAGQGDGLGDGLGARRDHRDGRRRLRRGGRGLGRRLGLRRLGRRRRGRGRRRGRPAVRAAWRRPAAGGRGRSRRPTAARSGPARRAGRTAPPRRAAAARPAARRVVGQAGAEGTSGGSVPAA